MNIVILNIVAVEYAYLVTEPNIGAICCRETKKLNSVIAQMFWLQKEIGAEFNLVPYTQYLRLEFL